MLKESAKVASIFQKESSNFHTENLDRIFEAQQAAFRRNLMPGAPERIRHLQLLKQSLIKNQEKLIATINDDFSCRSRDETLLAEILPSVEGIRYAARRVKKWMKPARRNVGLLFMPARARVIYQPLGVVGIITPWNYPLYLAVGPLTSALAAGNRVIIKMSRNTPRTGLALKTIIHEFFEEDHVAVITGEDGLGSAFSHKPWDHLVFTGSTAVGRRVMKAASDNLTPVLLELGGKSPAIISATVPMQDAAERIAFGKLFNVGQTCVAPDYVLCPKDRVDEFAAGFKNSVAQMYPSMDGNPQYTSIINEQEFARLKGLVDDARSKGARVIPVNPAGESFSGGRKMPIQVLLDVTEDMQVMEQEIFGPILPVVAYDTLKDAVMYVNSRPRPLALYFFDYQRENIDYVMNNTHSGGALINDTLVHVAQDDLPFGGSGESGMGRYHGKEGFLALSNAKGVLFKPRFNSGKLVYPPYGKLIHRLIYAIFLR